MYVGCSSMIMGGTDVLCTVHVNAHSLRLLSPTYLAGEPWLRRDRWSDLLLLITWWSDFLRCTVCKGTRLLRLDDLTCDDYIRLPRTVLGNKCHRTTVPYKEVPSLCLYWVERWPMATDDLIAPTMKIVFPNKRTTITMFNLFLPHM